MKSQGKLANQKGIVLAVVLLILVVILLLGTAMVTVSVTENQAASIVSDTKSAFLAAETGLQEAIYRMRLAPAALTDEGDTVCSATADPVVVGEQGNPTTSWADPTSADFWKYNPPACSWAYSGGSAAGYGNYFGGNAANLDSAGRTFASSGSAHAAGGALAKASLANGATYTVTVAAVVGFVGGCWQYVDQSGVPLGSCASVVSNPMFKVISTGTVRSARKTLSTMIQRYNINPKPDAMLTANSPVDVQSAAAVIDGHNFDCNGNNLSDTNSVKAVTVPSGETVNFKPKSLQCAAGIGSKCVGTSSPFPSTLGELLLGQGANSKDVKALNDYLESIKVPSSQAPISAFNGIVYINGDYQKIPDGSQGILIVHNATNTANLGNSNAGGTFKGLIIADQISQINGSLQVIGAVIAYGSAGTVTVNDLAGTPNLKYSKCQIDGLNHYFPFQGVRGTWLEQ